MAENARFHVVMPVATRARLNGLAEDTGLAAAALTRLAIDRLLAEPDPLGQKGAKTMGTQEQSATAIAKAEAAFAEAKVLAEGSKQSAIAAAIKLKMPEHSAAIREAERKYQLDLATAADASGGIIASAPYHAAETG